MTFQMTVAFAAAFFLLALSPGPGLVAILSRSLGSGMPAGLAVTSGLVVGDAVFLAIAMVGLSAIATALGPMFQVVKYAGAAYLIWLGIKTIQSASQTIEFGSRPDGALSAGVRPAIAVWKDIGLGLVVTLGNPKPILFYGAILPTFLDLSTVTVADFGILMSVVVGVSFVVYLGYMLLIERARRLLTSTHALKRMNQGTGAVLIGSGVAVAMR